MKKVLKQVENIGGGGYFSLLKDKLSTINKTNLKVRLKVVISTILVGLFIVLMSTSYALWTINSEKNNVFTIVVGDLSYRLTCDQLDSNQEITIPSNGTRTIVLNISSLNNITSTYKLYYTNNDGIEAKYYKNDNYTGTGNLDPKQGVAVKVLLKNNTNAAKKVKVGVQGGLLNKDLVLNEGVGITTQFIGDIILAYNYIGEGTAPVNFPGKGEGYEVTKVDCQNATGKWDYGSWGTLITNITGTEASCIINYRKQYKDGTGAGIPELLEGMIPVTYNGSNWIKADTANKWYDYNTQMWANAVTVTETNRNSLMNANPGTVIPIADINTMWVWIPKYEYKVEGQFGKGGTSAALPGEIEVNFVTKTDITPISGYTLHPAFNFGGENLSGIWVGKFQTTGTINSPTIKPNEPSIRYQTVSSFFNASRAMQNIGNPYGFSSATGDTHMMKNTEWGAVAYLSQSKYGKYGNPNYAGASKEVYINNSSSYITGCSAGNSSAKEVSGCTNTYNIDKAGTGASTTGTIYGAYDMSGGGWEYTMGVYNQTIGASGFTTLPNQKYYNNYGGSTGIKGDATNADGTNGWYADGTGFVYNNEPWFIRSGGYYGSNTAGIFYHANHTGATDIYYSSRFSIKP